MMKWEYQRIGDVCTVERGGSPRPIDEYITKAPDGINWIKIGDTTDSMYITQTEQKIRPEGMKKSRFVHVGDFLLSNSMSFGRPYILAIDGCIHDGWLVLHDDENRFDKRFLYYFLSAPMTYQKFEHMAVGGVVNNLNSKMVRNLEVPVPSRAEQQDIADRLDCITEIISNRKRVLALLDELVKSRFVEMFGDLSLNDKNWPIEPFTHCAKIDSNMIQDFAGYEDYPHIGIDSIEKETGRLLEYRTVREDGVISGKYLFTPNHIIYSKIRPNLNKVALPTFVGLCSADAYPILPNAEVCNRIYLAYVLRGRRFLNYILAFSSRTNMPKVNRKQVEGFELPLPPFPLQQKFAAFVHQIDATKAAARREIAALETLRGKMMQEFFG